MHRWLMVFATVAGMLSGSATLIAQQGQKSASTIASEKQASHQSAAAAQDGSSRHEDTSGTRNSATRVRAGKALLVADKGFAPKVASPVTGVPLARIQPAKPNDSLLLDYVPEEVFFVGAIQPAKLLNARLLRDTISKAGAEDIVEDLSIEAAKEMVFNPLKIVEVGLFIDKATLDAFSKKYRESEKRMQSWNNVMQIGLSMHNFHDAYNSFPNSDGFKESKGNLSWRVHLLPYLDAVDLYEQFNLDEPWDSEHNKPLIAKMPDVFKVDGVDDPGKTSIHLLTGDGMPFGGEKPIGFLNVTDGTSNTILTVVGGADTAQEWTKPGGLEIDPENPLKGLGKTGDSLLVGLMDGSVREFPADIDPKVFLYAAQHQDGNVVNLPNKSVRPSLPAPGLIVRYAEEIDQQAVVAAYSRARTPEDIEIDGRPALRFSAEMSLMFADKKTMLLSSESTLKLMVAKRGKPGTVKEEFLGLYPANDGAAVGRLDLEDDQIEELFKGTPLIGILQNLVKATAIVDATGENESFLNLAVETEDAQTAQQIMGLTNGGFQIFKGQFLSEISREGSGVSENVVEVLSEIVESVSIEAEESSVTLNVPKVDDPKQLMTDLEPAIKELAEGIRAGRARAKEFEKLNSIREVGLAMHNYHATFNGFPSWNTPQGKGDNKGLSWRVYMLPYVGEVELYNKFKLDEPWDSDHNKALIENMPKVYQTAGVEERGKTSMHVFLGEKTPFGGDERTGFRDIHDGTSNTLMFVQAGTDKADVWTKPSGLEYDPDDPKKCLGNVGDKFMVIMCDGVARFIDADIDNDTFRRLIEHQDGEAIGDF